MRTRCVSSVGGGKGIEEEEGRGKGEGGGVDALPPGTLASSPQGW